jgi:hypothetical protein
MAGGFFAKAKKMTVRGVRFITLLGVISTTFHLGHISNFL